MTKEVTNSVAVGAKVLIDGDKSIVARVTGIWFLGAGGVKIEASWMHNGQSYANWFPRWRLTLAEEEDT